MNISFLQWNIWYREDIHNISKYLKAHPADILCLQELIINHPEQTELNTAKYIAEQLGYNFFAPEIELYDNVRIANGIFSRFPITRSRQAWINEPLGKGGYDDEHRAYVEAVLDIDDKELSVGTSHMSYTHKFEVTDRKRKETDKLTKELIKSKDNFIFSGDLNASPDSYVVKEISKLLEHSGPDYNEPTWTTKPFDYNGFKETELKWRLDYIFTSKDLKLLSSNIEQTDYSDHLPVRAVFEI